MSNKNFVLATIGGTLVGLILTGSLLGSLIANVILLNFILKDK